MTEEEKQKLDSLSKELSAFQLRFFNEFLPKINALDLQKFISLDEKIRRFDSVFQNMNSRIEKLDTPIKTYIIKATAKTSEQDKQYVWEKTDTKPWYRRFLE